MGVHDSYQSMVFFFFNDTATTEIYTLSLHDALPICFLPSLARASGRSDLSWARTTVAIIKIPINRTKVFLGFIASPIAQAVNLPLRLSEARPLARATLNTHQLDCTSCPLWRSGFSH